MSYVVNRQSQWCSIPGVFRVFLPPSEGRFWRVFRLVLGEQSWLLGGWAHALAGGHVSQPPPPIYSSERSTSQTQSALQFAQNTSSQFIPNTNLHYSWSEKALLFRKQTLRYIVLNTTGLSIHPFSLENTWTYRSHTEGQVGSMHLWG